MSGRDLCRRFYEQAVRPLIPGVPHAAALLGEGSEVLGFDDEVSTDHDFGPRVQLFVPPGLDTTPIEIAMERLPARFDGFPVVYPDGDRYDGWPHHQVEVTTARVFFVDRLGVDPADGMDLADWLLAPTQILASLTAGVVLHDPLDLLTARRRALAWYPDDVWRYVLAAGWLRVSQEEPFIGRTGSRGDDLGSRILAARLARDLVRIGFLLECRWAPYSKWLMTAFGQLTLADQVGEHLGRALDAPRWRDREAALCAAASHLATATNRLGLAEPVDPAPRRFHSRNIQVLGAQRLTRVLTDAISDPGLRALLTRLGHQPDGPLGHLPGAIDQATDSVEILTQPNRRRDYAALLGLWS
ncbi:DUF4037 domain-containing protein [Frankia sp. B2]|uniref:DUF4037 domain-containing protein n=1 Tax=Frankia casuarinae (strain DSM 45818 / CECT 9043 / HFP020203 / CcI3) TaxID=106370 RepID=Q2JBW1_FRACC|nr:hypothetical protein Francci3_1855 [Frankia casuarinae]ORT46770.1 hypothetical protein KBI5_23390 [Frankia sp. KB5]TFE29649.1 DUF4037 domain-containing protein [Frankia sp. B2]